MKALRTRRRAALAGLACAAMFAVPAMAQASVPKVSWAVVDGGGVLARSSPDVVSTSHVATGAYAVITNHDVTNCAYVADPGLTGSVGAIGAPAFTVTALRAGTTTGVFVNAFDRTGAVADEPFHLHIDCNPKGRWAVVNADGSISRRSNKVTGATRLGAGQYEVDFARPVSKCAYTANVGNPGAGNPAALTSSVATRFGNKLGVFIFIQNTSGVGTDASFHLDVACGKNALGAVVNTAGVLVRGMNTTGASHLAAGAYEVDFNRDVSGCSFVASLGDPGTGVAPQGTATVAGRNGNTFGVFIQTFGLDGTQADRPFQLIVFC
jgi:hypothetical protein